MDILLRVSDRGPGVAVVERERIFEPFYRRPTGRWRMLRSQPSDGADIEKEHAVWIKFHAAAVMTVKFPVMSAAEGDGPSAGPGSSTQHQGRS